MTVLWIYFHLRFRPNLYAYDNMSSGSYPDLPYMYSFCRHTDFMRCTRFELRTIYLGLKKWVDHILYSLSCVQINYIISWFFSHSFAILCSFNTLIYNNIKYCVYLGIWFFLLFKMLSAWFTSFICWLKNRVKRSKMMYCLLICIFCKQIY
jgi:hypothetical protein